MMQFLLNQQSHFAADFAKSLERQERFEPDMNNLSGKTDRIAEGLLGLTRIVGQLAASQQRGADQLDRVESHLNVVVEMFERHLREDHGGPPVS